MPTFRNETMLLKIQLAICISLRIKLSDLCNGKDVQENANRSEKCQGRETFGLRGNEKYLSSKMEGNRKILIFIFTYADHQKIIHLLFQMWLLMLSPFLVVSKSVESSEMKI